jgi:hypothetical protein
MKSLSVALLGNVVTSVSWHFHIFVIEHIVTQMLWNIEASSVYQK